MEAEAVAAVLLGAIEREIGLNHHGIGPGDVGRVARYPDADRDMDLVALDDIGLGQDFSDLGRQRACRRQILGAALQDRKLVAAEARHDVGLADGIADAACDLPQQLIADGVAERIVDVLEIIEIEIKHGKRRRAAAARCKCRGQPPHKATAVGERSQRVHLRKIGESLIDPHHAQRMASRRADIGHDRAGEDEPECQHDPRPIVMHGQRAVRHRPRDHRQPGQPVRLEIAAPVTAGGGRSARQRCRRRGAEPGWMHVERHGLRAAVGREEKQVEPFGRFGVGDDAVDHPRRDERAVDKPCNVAPPIFNRVVRRATLINRQRKQEAALGAAGGDQRGNRREAQAICVSRSFQFHQFRRFGPQIEAVQPRRAWQRCVEYRKVLTLLGRPSSCHRHPWP